MLIIFSYPQKLCSPQWPDPELERKRTMSEVLRWCKEHNTYIRRFEHRRNELQIELESDRIATVFQLTWQGRQYRVDAGKRTKNTRGYKQYRTGCVHASL